MLTRDECEAIAERITGLSTADEWRLNVDGGERMHLRYARNAPTTSGADTDHRVTLTSTFGARSGSATVNQVDYATLDDLVARSEQIARRAPEDPEHMPVLEPQTYASADGWEQGTADRAPELMAEGVSGCIENAIRADVHAAGFARTDASFRALANSAGLSAYSRSTVSSFSQTSRTLDGAGSGWASDASRSVADIDFTGKGFVATAKALSSRDPQPLEPGTYPVILESACVASLIELLIGAMDARSADEGRSFFSAPGGGNRFGEQLFPEGVTISSDPSDVGCPADVFGGEGLPQRGTTWIDRGRVANLRYDRWWAARNEQAPAPRPSNILMSGGDGTILDLIASTERGVLVTSLWYIRSVDPRTLLHTGLTRDGVFWVEDGEIRHPVTNFRWNDSPVSVLESFEAAGRPVRVAARGGRGNHTVAPAIRCSAFHLSSVSDAV